jgi:hypothetical protein
MRCSSSNSSNNSFRRSSTFIWSEGSSSSSYFNIRSRPGWRACSSWDSLRISQQQQQQHLHEPGRGRSDGLVAIARRLQTKPLESPETARCPQGVPALNLSASSWSEDRELEDEFDGIGSSPTYAEVASKAPAAPAATAAATTEEGEEPPQPTPTPWSCYFCHCSNHSLRELCIMCLQSRASTEGVPHVDLI